MQGLAVVRKAEDVLRSSLAARRSECMRIRQAAREALEENRRRRRAMAEEVRQQLRIYRAKFLSSSAPAQRAMNSAVEAADAIAIEPAIAGAPQRSAIESSSPEAGQTASIVNVWKPNAPETEEGGEPPVDAADVLGVIKTHREGIGLADLGNELGVDWRLLIGIVRRLLDEGEIEQIQQLLYAVAE